MNDKQRRFAEEYMVDMIATQAALRAGYSPKTAYAQGSALLKHPEVSKYIEELKVKRAKRTEVSADRVLLEYARVAYANAKDFYDDDGDLKPIGDLSDDDAACITDVTVTQRFEGDDVNPVRIQTKKVKRASKTKALDALGKHLGLFEKDNAQRQQPIIINPPDIKKPKNSGQ